VNVKVSIQERYDRNPFRVSNAPGPEIATMRQAGAQFIVTHCDNAANTVQTILGHSVLMLVLKIKKRIADLQVLKLFFGHADIIRLSNNGL
jgi:hypothetical protein